MDIAVIGAGPAGIMAALRAAGGGARVTLFEHNLRVGRKLLVTGSGRCNLTNQSLNAAAYTIADQGWMNAFLAAFSPADLRQELDALGIPTFATPDGWVYPLSESAQSVVSILEEALLQRQVNLRVAINITGFSHCITVFELQIGPPGQHRTETFDALVVAAGGKAYPELGSKGELFPSLARLGHTVNPLRPALGPIHARLGAYQLLKGLRFDVLAAILKGNRCLGETDGNLIVTEQGFNGPGVMNLSHWVALEEPASLKLRLDFLGQKASLFTGGMANRSRSQQSVQSYISAFMAPKASDLFIRVAGLDPTLPLRDLTTREVAALTAALQQASFQVTGAGIFKDSQVTVGGVPVAEVDPTTCQSRLVPGLYLVGETLDVAGPCGGYNLHFAFGSGFLAGQHLANSQVTQSKETA